MWRYNTCGALAIMIGNYHCHQMELAAVKPLKGNLKVKATAGTQFCHILTPNRQDTEINVPWTGQFG